MLIYSKKFRQPSLNVNDHLNKNGPRNNGDTMLILKTYIYLTKSKLSKTSMNEGGYRRSGIFRQLLRRKLNARKFLTRVLNYRCLATQQKLNMQTFLMRKFPDLRYVMANTNSWAGFTCSPR